MQRIKFYLDQKGTQQAIYSENTNIANLERQAMERAKSEAEAAFLRDFGVVGKFELTFVRSKIGGKGAAYINGTRPTYRLSAADKTTAAKLKTQPHWLDQFSKNAKF